MINSVSNYHTHTRLCGHGKGMPADYVLEAACHNVSELGFSDHCPYPAGSDTWPDIRMSADDADGYIKAIRDAASTSPFPIKAGFECEWDKDYQSWYLDKLLGAFKADYLVLGPHWVTLGKGHLYVLDITDKATLNRYIAQTIEGIQTGIFSFVAHPDIFMGRWREWDETARSVSKDLIAAAIECNMPLEINGLGLKRQSIMTKNGGRKQYPYLEFWLMAKEMGATVICNSDAHTPQDVIKDAYKAREFAANAGLAWIERI